MLNRFLLCVAVLMLAACGSQPPRPVVDRTESAPQTPSIKPASKPAITKRGGGYYQDDGPGENAPAPEALAATPDAVPKKEPLHRFANNPYTVLGKDYVPLRPGASYRKTGIASWYGKKFHGQKTSSGEIYDMYGMSAAHPILPIPSYVRVSNNSNGKSVIVRVNDRGPFHADRIIDLSYTAAWKLELIGNGSGQVTVELIQPGDEVYIAKAAPPQSTQPTQPTQAAQTNQATSAAAEPAVQAGAAQSSAAPGAYIQLGAFGNPDNAESFRSHIARELDWLSDRLRLEPSGKVLRVQAGPFRDRSEAEAVVARIRAALGVSPTIIFR